MVDVLQPLQPLDSSGLEPAAVQYDPHGADSGAGYIPLGYGAPYTVDFTLASGTVKKAVLMRPGSATHHCDFDQRTIVLQDNLAATGWLNFTTPSNRNLAPPGWYMLFLVSNHNVPSVAYWVQLL